MVARKQRRKPCCSGAFQCTDAQGALKDATFKRGLCLSGEAQQLLGILIQQPTLIGGDEPL
ncbi:hypothetical protein GT93_25810 [Pseudomonas plecoglossicida]|nr:hypothetical protein GT93_25810 [Pseudomonas plecoglossicida]